MPSQHFRDLKQFLSALLLPVDMIPQEWCPQYVGEIFIIIVIFLLCDMGITYIYWDWCPTGNH